MRAIGTSGSSLVVSEVPVPDLRPGEVLLDVYASALNRADLSQAAGHYPAPPGESEIMGLEAAGVVVEAPDGGGWLGRSACALLAGGGYAERVAVPSGMLMPVPSGWTYLQAAALPEATLTAYLNLFIEARLKAGERVLVHGGASGVGLAAIRLAKLAGCVVYATAGGAAKVAACTAQGADLALDRHGPPFVDAILLHGGGAGIDVVLDMVGQPYFEANLDLLATKGRIVYISALGGREVTLDIRALMAKRAHLIGSTLRGRPLAEKMEILASFVDRFGDALTGPDLLPVIDSVYPLAEAGAAHERMRRNENIGKIVLQVKPEAGGVAREADGDRGRRP